MFKRTSRIVSSSRPRLIGIKVRFFTKTPIQNESSFSPFGSSSTRAFDNTPSQHYQSTESINYKHTPSTHFETTQPDTFHSTNTQAKKITVRKHFVLDPNSDQTLAKPDPSLEYDAAYIAMEKKRKLDNQRHHDAWMQSKQRKVDKRAFLPEGTNDEVLAWEVRDLLSRNGNVDIPVHHQGKLRDLTTTAGYTKPVELKEDVELEVVKLSSTGDGLALNDAKDHVFVIPFTVPGDRVKARPWSWKGLYTTSDFLEIVRPAESRTETPKCKYFGKCSGCQLQMLSYEKQLEHKRGIVQQAYEIFSGLSAGQMPDVGSTFASPLQYGYRTKLSPHFTPPYFNRRNKPADIWKDGMPPIGFNAKQTGKVMDIESCPLGTEIVNEGMARERQYVTDNLQSYKKGATLLLRETTDRRIRGADPAGFEGQHPSDPRQWHLKSKETLEKAHAPQIVYEYEEHTDTKTYTSEAQSDACEYITTTIDASTTPPMTKMYKFTNYANSFFQNNNSILGPFTSFIYGICIPKGGQVKYLLDAYSGSGLFTLTLSPLFKSSLGIDIDKNSITAARKNAQANKVKNAGFLDADASALFADVPYPAHETLVIIDPPRKGCDREFLMQLRRFGAARVVYVSCNVHTQARDVGVLVNGFTEKDADWEDKNLAKYEIESLRGFDFFPQTGHVEGVCVLNRVDTEAKQPAAESAIEA